jgi:hypothetical protein
MPVLNLLLNQRNGVGKIVAWQPAIFGEIFHTIPQFRQEDFEKQ